MNNPKSKLKERCCKTVYFHRGLISHQCLKMATVIRDGKHYCTFHDPVLKAEKLKAKFAAMDAARDAEVARNQRIDKISREYPILAEIAEAAISVYKGDSSDLSGVVKSDIRLSNAVDSLIELRKAHP